MSAAELRPVLIGGPHDGAVLATGRRSAFVYCAVARKVNGEYRCRSFSMPGSGRCLYRLVEDGKYLFAGLTHVRCEGCQAYRVAGPKCALCGHESRTDRGAAK